jgi:hypothetical protein
VDFEIGRLQPAGGQLVRMMPPDQLRDETVADDVRSGEVATHVRFSQEMARRMAVGAAAEPHEILSASDLCAVGIRCDRLQTGCDQSCLNRRIPDVVSPTRTMRRIGAHCHAPTFARTRRLLDVGMAEPVRSVQLERDGKARRLHAQCGGFPIAS